MIDPPELSSWVPTSTLRLPALPLVQCAAVTTRWAAISVPPQMK